MFSFSCLSQGPILCQIFGEIWNFDLSACNVLFSFLDALNTYKKRCLHDFCFKTCLECQGSNPCEKEGVFTWKGTSQRPQGFRA